MFIIAVKSKAELYLSTFQNELSTVELLRADLW